MRAKKNVAASVLLFFLLGLSAVSFSEVDLSDEASRKEAEKILENTRKRIMKEDKEREAERKRQEEERIAQEKAMREKQGEVAVIEDSAVVEATEVSETMELSNADMTDEKLVKEYLKEKERLKREEKKNLKTPMEKLEYTRKEALEKIDFYERVVRSVAREEQEIGSYKEILDMDI